MPPDKMYTYLSDALDQEACKKTLMEALQSRVLSLQSLGISNATIIICLEDIGADPHQLNGDIIDDVVEWVFLMSMA